MLLFEAKKEHGLYRLDVNIHHHSTDIAPEDFGKKALQWHKRFGYVNFDKLSKIRDINISNKEMLQVSQQYLCESCQLGKFTRQSFTTKKGILACRPLELVHMDLCGPLHVPSIGGARYLYVITNDYTRKTFAYSLSCKDEYFRRFKALTESELGLSIIKVRSDRGGEFKSHIFGSFCSNHGITQEFTPSYTPQLNGVAERKNRTIMDMVRCMLIDSKLSLEFWGEAY